MLAWVSLAAALAAAPPHFFMVLQDDLGHYDVGWTNPAARDVTGNLTALAEDGVVLSRHYVFYWCSPTRRSFLSGRLPVHHGEVLSGYASDDIDLRWKTIPEKLQPQGYKSYWFGKGHTGYKSMRHLPVNRGFENFTGFLIGMQSYTATDRWSGEAPLHTNEYSTTLYGDAAVAALAAHDPAVPMFMYLPWQAVHDPYDDVPGWPHNGEKPAGTYRGMLWMTDVYVGRLVGMMKEKGMWENTLMVYSADNGGRGDGINYPYRGEKRTNYEGGMRVAAFVSGGLLPEKIRGTTNDIRFHIVDWYPTFCNLAGVAAADDPPTPPSAVPPSDPPPTPIPAHTAPYSGVDWLPATDIYGNSSYPGIDGVDIWGMLTAPAGYGRDSAHPTLLLSHEVLVSGRWKLMVAQRGDTKQNWDSFEAGWRYPNYTWVTPATRTCGEVAADWGKTAFKPCLFDLEADPREQHDLSGENPERVAAMWKQLNDSWRTFYVARSPAELMGPCDADCANAKWVAAGGVSGHGPVCGVPGCPAPPAPPSTQCTFTPSEGLGGKSLRVAAAATKEECCGMCRGTAGCLAADWNNRTAAGAPSASPMCHLKNCVPDDCGSAHAWGLACTPLRPQ